MTSNSHKFGNSTKSTSRSQKKEKNPISSTANINYY